MTNTGAIEDLIQSEDFKEISKSLDINVYNLKKAALIVRALNHKLRQQMLRYMHEKGNTPVTEMYKKLKVVQSIASNHLKILRDAGYVVTKREGKQIYYSVNYERLEEVNRIIGELIVKR